MSYTESVDGREGARQDLGSPVETTWLSRSAAAARSCGAIVVAEVGRKHSIGAHRARRAAWALSSEVTSVRGRGIAEEEGGCVGKDEQRPTDANIRW